MLFSASTTTHETQPSLTVEDDARISELSVFSDDVWDFTSEMNRPSLTRPEVAIDWKFQLTEKQDSLDPAYSSIVLSLKQLAYSMLNQPKPRKCATVIGAISSLKRFVRFISNMEMPVYRFHDVLESNLERYIEDLKLRSDGNGELAPSTIATELIQLNKLFDYKDYLSDHLRFRPTKSKTPAQVAGFKRNASGSKTEAIPDNELKPLIDTALSYMQEKASSMLKCLEEYYLFAETSDMKSFRWNSSRSVYVDQYFFSKRNDYCSSSDLNAALIYLRNACFIIIAFCTGMRLSEILAIKRGCIRQEKNENHGVFYWIDSLLFKTQGKNSGTPRTWMCGPLGAQAVAVLERMGELMGAHQHTPYLIFSFTHYAATERAFGSRIFKCVSCNQIRSELKRFCAVHHLGEHVHPHRLRRTFARNIIRYSSTSILALKEHFKHWSLYMTDWYVGLDRELLDDLEAERLLLSIEVMEKISTQPVSGAGGRRWTRELEVRIKEGKLPRNFRGKAGAEFRKKMIGGLHESGMIVIPCGSFTFCVFQKDRALCTKGDRPVVNRCNPYDCSNSYILPENVPFYRGKLAVLQAQLDKFSEEEKSSPAGVLCSGEIRKINRYLEPFTEK